MTARLETQSNIPVETVEYLVFLEIDGRGVPYFEPVAASDDDRARAGALDLLRARRDASEAMIYRGDLLVAVLDRSGLQGDGAF